MNSAGPSPQRRVALHGFSLVELMVATTIGLLVLGGVGSIFLGSRNSFRTQENLAQVQEAGRFLTYLMIPHIRQAGYLPDPLAQVDTSKHFRGPWRPIFGADDGFFAASDVTGIADVQPGTDALLVVHGGDSVPLSTCRGTTVADDQIAANVFYVSARDPGSGLSSLNCGTAVLAVGRGAALRSPTTPVAITDTQPLIHAVQDLQITYGVAAEPADDGALPAARGAPFAARYLDADAVPDWQRVVAVRISVTAVGAERSEGGEGGGNGGQADGMVIDRFVEGGRVRRLFSNTVQIRNRLRQS